MGGGGLERGQQAGQEGLEGGKGLGRGRAAPRPVGKRILGLIPAGTSPRGWGGNRVWSNEGPLLRAGCEVRANNILSVSSRKQWVLIQFDRIPEMNIHFFFLFSSLKIRNFENYCPSAVSLFRSGRKAQWTLLPKASNNSTSE